MKKLKQVTCILLSVLMLAGIMPAQTFASEPIPLEATEQDERLIQDGMFYFVTNTASLSEEEANQYQLKIVRKGDGEGAATVRLQMLDITANYGEDYQVYLSGGGAKVQNADESRSLMDQFIEEGVEEDLEQDLAMANMTEEDIAAAQQQAQEEFGAALSEELSAYANQYPGRYTSEATDADRLLLATTDEEPGEEATALEHPATVPLSESDSRRISPSLSDAYEASTGRIDDWTALSSDGSAILDTTTLLLDYSMDVVGEIGEGLNSAYLDIPFADGETERYISIKTHDNDEAEGDLYFMLRLESQDDSVRVSSDYGRAMLTIADNEEWERPVISFAAERFVAEDGLVSVTLRREGILSVAASVRLTTSDGTAKCGTDYSQVEADVTFPFGIAERTIYIPIRSTWLWEQASFHMSLSEARNCSIGAAEAEGVIEKDSMSFELTFAEAEDDEDSATRKATADHKDGDPLDLSKFEKEEVQKDGDIWMDGTTCMLKADSNGKTDGRVWTRARWVVAKDILRDGNIPELTGKAAIGIEYNGVRVKVSRNDNGNPQSDLAYWNAWYPQGSGYTSWTAAFQDLGADNSTIEHKEFFYWDSSTDAMKNGVRDVSIQNSHTDGWWRHQNTLEVEEIVPILRPFVVSLEIANPEALRYVDNQGRLVSYDRHDSAKSAGELVLGGAEINDNTVVKYVGDFVEVRCQGLYSYIKYLELADENGNTMRVTPEYPVGNTIASFALDTSALTVLHQKGLITYSKNPDGIEGTVGNLRLRVVMGKIPTSLTLNNDDERGWVKLSFDVHNGRPNGTEMPGDDRDYHTIYRGDYVRFEETLDYDYRDSFTAYSIRIKRDRQENSNQAGYTRTASELFDVGQSKWQVTMFNDYNGLTVWPSFSDIDNHIVVRVADKDKAKFDTTKGIFTARTIPGISGYTDYEIVPQKNFTTYKYYDLLATPKDAGSVAIWTPGNSSVSYSQNTYHHETKPETSSNLIVLTCQQADPTPYALCGDAYYAALNLRNNVEGATWMPADGLSVELTPEVFAVSDDTGKFTSVPFYGVAGCRVVMRTESMGTVNYKYVTLTKGVVKPIGDEVSSVDAYQVPLGTIVVPVVNSGVASIRAASLADKDGIETSSITVWADALESAKHRFTISATTINEGLTYTDSDGTQRVENVKAVEFWAYDAGTNTQRGKLAEDNAVQITDNGDGSRTYSITLGFDMTDDNLQKYHPGDKVYVRLITDRVRGNGKSIDENGNEVENPTLQETVYAPVYTGYDLVSAANYTPPMLSADILDTDMTKEGLFEKLPIIGALNVTMRVANLAVSQLALPNGGISLCVGVRFRTEKDYESPLYNFQTASDDGFKATLSKAKDWAKIVHGSPKTGLAVRNAGVNPFVGLYLDFGVKELGVGDGSLKADLTLIGGGFYVGCIGFFKMVFYAAIGPVPFYFGIEGDIIGYVNMGFQIPDNAVTLEDVANGGGLETFSTYDFKLIAQALARAYVGIGLAGTIGVRGGFSYDMAFIWYPSVHHINPDYHQFGFTLTLNLQLWIDAYIFSIPAPKLQLAHQPFGYYKDIEEDLHSVDDAALRSAGNNEGPSVRQAPTPSAWLPESDTRATVREDWATTLLENNYPYSDPQMIDTGFSLVLVFLTTEAAFGTNEKAVGDETTLACSVYRYENDDFTPVENPTWSKPVRIGNAETLKTGDFQPHLEVYFDMFDEEVAQFLVSWVSRKDETWAEDPGNPTTEESLEYLRDMEVYTASFDVHDSDVVIYDVQRVTDDDYYNSEPQAYWAPFGETMEQAVICYQASDPGIQDIAADEPVYEDFPNEGSRQLLENLSANRNGAFLMYKTYDYDTHAWVGKTPAGSFMETPVNGQNRPVIEDLAVREFLFETPDGDQEYILCAYTVDGDGNLSTQYDRELYLQMYDPEEDQFYAPIQLTDDPDKTVSRPQFTDMQALRCYLFWYEQTAPSVDESSSTIKENGDIRFLDLRELFTNGLDIDKTAGTATVKDKITAAELMARPEYAALTAEEKAELGELTDYDYELPVHTVTIPETDEFKEGPSVASFVPYMDNEQNLFIVWNQNLSHTIEHEDGTTEEVTVSELYASARIEEINQTSSVWSRPQRLTFDNKFYDENTPLIYANVQQERFKDTVFAVANRYEYALTLEGETEPVDSADLVAVHFGFTSSLKAENIRYGSEYPKAGEEVQVTLDIANDGLLASDGGSYVIQDWINGAPGDFELSGTLDSMLPDEAAEITFAYPMPEDLSGIDKIRFKVTTQEEGFPDESTEIVFGEDDAADAIPVAWSPLFTEVQTEERSDGFYVTCRLENEGNVTMPAGSVLINVGDTGNMEQIWATRTLDKALEPGESVSCTMKLEDVPDEFTSAMQRGFLLATDPEGNVFDSLGSSRDIFLTLEQPYNVVVNGDESLPEKGITIKTGDTLSLTGDYEGKSWFTDAELQFTTLDSGVATAYEGTLYAMEPGETTLVAKVAKYGGTVTIPVKVVDHLENPFTDVKEDAFYYDPVLWAYYHDPQITAGTSNTTFSPNGKATRAQVVTFLYRAAGEPTVADGSPVQNPFTDVKDDAYYFNAVLWAVENNITKGTSDTTFSPNKTCTRGEFVTFLYRFAGSPTAADAENPFEDVKESAFYYTPVLWAVEQKVTAGTSATTFSPNKKCTRGEIVTFLYRYMGEE